MVLLDWVFFEELADLNLQEKTINPVPLIESEEWMHSKTLYENNTAYVLSFNTSNQTNIISEKELLSKHKTDSPFLEDIERLQKCINANDPIIKKRCSEIGLITQSHIPVFDKNQHSNPMATSVSHPSKLFKMAPVLEGFDLGKKDPSIKPQIPKIAKNKQPKKKAQINFRKAHAAPTKTTKKRQLKNSVKTAETKPQPSKDNSNKRQKVSEKHEEEGGDNAQAHLHSSNKVEDSMQNDSSIEIQEEKWVNIAKPINHQILTINEIENEQQECKSDGDKSGNSIIVISEKENKQVECTYSAPEVVVSGRIGKPNKKARKNVSINITKSWSNDPKVNDITITEQATAGGRSNTSMTRNISELREWDTTARSEPTNESRNITITEGGYDDIEIRLDSETPMGEISETYNLMIPEEIKAENTVKQPKPRRKRRRKVTNSQPSESSDDESAVSNGVRRSRRICKLSQEMAHKIVNLPESSTKESDIDNLQPVEEIEDEEAKASVEKKSENYPTAAIEEISQTQ